MEKLDSPSNEELSRGERIKRMKNKLTIYHQLIDADSDFFERYSRDAVRIHEFEQTINEKLNIKLTDYIFWHWLIGSSPRAENITSSNLDTSNHDIENLLDQLISG